MLAVSPLAQLSLPVILVASLQALLSRLGMLLANHPVVLVESPRVPPNHLDLLSLPVILVVSLQAHRSLLASHQVLSNHLVMLVVSPRVQPNRLEVVM